MLEHASFGSSPISVTDARSWLSGRLRSHGYEAVSADAELCLAELAANALRHAGTSFAVALRDESGTVFLEVRDEGGGTPARQRPEPTDPSGRGLMIVDAVTSRWGVIDHEPRGKTVWCAFDVDSP